MFKNKLVNIVLIVLAGYVILSMINSNYESFTYGSSCNAGPAEFKEGFEAHEKKDDEQVPQKKPQEKPQEEPMLPKELPQQPQEPQGDSVPGYSGCNENERLKPTELLPSDGNDWSDSAPGTGSAEGSSLLEAGYHIGTDTIGQSLRNANLSIRSEPPNPRTNVSPWLNTTIEPDLTRNNICPA